MKCCIELSCPQLTYQDLDDIIYSAKEQLCLYMDAFVSESEYGYSCIDDSWKKYERLLSDLKIMELYRKQAYWNGDPCLCPDEIQTVIERVLDVAGKCGQGLRTDMIIDDSELIDWKVNNPYCIPRQAWENALYKKCTPITFNIEVIKKISECDITFDLVTFINAVGRCELRYSIDKVPTKDCKIEYKILKEELPNCSISFTTYKELRNCGIDYALIKETADCGVSFNLNKGTGCPEITYNLKTFPICDWPSNIEVSPTTVT